LELELEIGNWNLELEIGIGNWNWELRYSDMASQV
jgi:hypothetical protein